MDFISYLKGLAEGYAHQSPNADYEIQHLLDVEQEVVKLCNQRDLSLEMGLIMAYGHDLGRLKAGVEGKKHSRVSSEIMKELLKDASFSSDKAKIICKGIARHNQKHKIHSRYSELIKDADSLAHGSEGIIERVNYYEHIRVLTADSNGVKIQAAPKEVWENALEYSFLKVSKCVQDEIAFSAQSEFWVHDLRVAIRRIRSILWILKHQNETEGIEKLRHLDKSLEKMSKHLEYVRILQVAIRKANLGQTIYSKFQKKIKNSFLVMGQQYDEIFPLEQVKQELYRVIEMVPSDLNSSCQYLFSKTIQQAKRVDLKESKKLHTLRIFSKRIKYLMQMNLVQVGPESEDSELGKMYEKTISELNDLLGDIHDLYEFEKLLKGLSISEELKELRKEVNKRIFFIVKVGHKVTI